MLETCHFSDKLDPDLRIRLYQIMDDAVVGKHNRSIIALIWMMQHLDETALYNWSSVLRSGQRPTIVVQVLGNCDCCKRSVRIRQGYGTPSNKMATLLNGNNGAKERIGEGCDDSAFGAEKGWRISCRCIILLETRLNGADCRPTLSDHSFQRLHWQG